MLLELVENAFSYSTPSTKPRSAAYCALLARGEMNHPEAAAKQLLHFPVSSRDSIFSDCRTENTGKYMERKKILIALVGGVCFAMGTVHFRNSYYFLVYTDEVISRSTQKSSKWRCYPKRCKPRVGNKQILKDRGIAGRACISEGWCTMGVFLSKPSTEKVRTYVEVRCAIDGTEEATLALSSSVSSTPRAF